MNKIPFKSVLQPIKDIEERNKVFHSLSNDKKRREIAYDVLTLILQGGMSGLNGDYWGKEIHSMRWEATSSRDLQELFINFPGVCNVCARGAAMYSQIRLGNHLRPTLPYIDCGTPEIIEGFSFNSFRTMENVYEGILENSSPYRNNSTELLANIFCNIIKNGEFNVDDNIDYLKEWNITIEKV